MSFIEGYELINARSYELVERCEGWLFLRTMTRIDLVKGDSALDNPSKDIVPLTQRKLVTKSV